LKLTAKNIRYIVLLILLAFFSWLMLRTIVAYRTLKLDVGFLQFKQEYIHIDIWRAAFFTHVFSSMFALVAGFTQFSKTILKRWPKLHRVMGYIYVIDILFVTGPAGLVMSIYANGGILSKIAFTLLSILWIGFTAIALNKARKKKFIEHKQFMIRSYALTLSALTLRSWKVLFAAFTDITTYNRYRITAWLGWGLNLLIAELIIRRQQKKKSPVKETSIKLYS
jgi:hypothetical protein